MNGKTFDTEQVVKGAKVLAELLNDISRLERQRDALLSAAKAAVPVLEGAMAFIDCKERLKQLRAAIAAAESKEQVSA